ncbi:hypothetical protein VTN77DRAFT_4173 [Rasamsonia byssochlamydoides]|uniref:uncharacterized protein n=1 Tax=Rasamsonia byssochlamydoides TaxID=89139 RepID=UPI00374319C4
MSLLALSNELLLLIAKYLQSQADINAFMQTNSRPYHLLNTYLYRYNVQYGHSSALLWGAEHGHETTIQKSLREGADVRWKSNYESLVQPVYFMGRWMRTLRSHGDFKKHPISSAAAQGHNAIVELLLDHGADPDFKDQCGRTSYPDSTIASQIQAALLHAAPHGHENIMQLMLERNVNVNFRNSNACQTPLSWAATSGQEAIAKLLLDHGADPNLWAEDVHSRKTPLSEAARYGHESLVKLLLENGADVGGCGRDALFRVIGNGHEAIVKLLIEKGVDPQSRDYLAQTTMTRAVSSGHPAIVKLLLANGVHPTRKNLEVARRGGKKDVVSVLEQWFQ